MPEGEWEALAGRLRGELRAVRQKQARLRYQVRYLLGQHTQLRNAVLEALTKLDEGSVDAAACILEQGLERASHDPDPHYTPPGARRRRPKGD